VIHRRQLLSLFVSGVDVGGEWLTVAYSHLPQVECLYLWSYKGKVQAGMDPASIAAQFAPGADLASLVVRFAPGADLASLVVRFALLFDLRQARISHPLLLG
jgi:hypothetical protein